LTTKSGLKLFKRMPNGSSILKHSVKKYSSMPRSHTSPYDA
jgi:hypothetical protein